MQSLVYLRIRTLVARIIGARQPGHDDGAKDLEILVLSTGRSGSTRTYDRGRPHRALGLAPPLAVAQISGPVEPREVRRRDLLGGLIHEYHGLVA